MGRRWIETSAGSVATVLYDQEATPLWKTNRHRDRATLSSEMVKLLDRDGFLSLPDLVSRPEVDMIRRLLTSLYDQNAGFAEGSQFDALGRDGANEPKQFLQILRPSEHAPALKKVEFRKLAGKMAREILGPGVRFVSDMALMKPAGSAGATPWHQDEAFCDPKFDHRFVTFWLALQHTDQSNGCMEFLPGSHKGPVLSHGFPDNDHRIHALKCIEALDTSKSVPCLLPAGGCTIHTAQTLHGTGPNRSNHPRLAYALIFDVVPTQRSIPRDFPWQTKQDTARAAREKAWRRRGGLLIFLWRRRSRVRFERLGYSLHSVWRIVKAAMRP